MWLAIAIALSSPLFVTIGTVLAIPASAAADTFLHGITCPLLSFVGGGNGQELCWAWWFDRVLFSQAWCCSGLLGSTSRFWLKEEEAGLPGCSSATMILHSYLHHLYIHARKFHDSHGRTSLTESVTDSD